MTDEERIKHIEEIIMAKQGFDAIFNYKFKVLKLSYDRDFYTNSSLADVSKNIIAGILTNRTTKGHWLDNFTDNDNANLLWYTMLIAVTVDKYLSRYPNINSYVCSDKGYGCSYTLETYVVSITLEHMLNSSEGRYCHLEFYNNPRTAAQDLAIANGGLKSIKLQITDPFYSIISGDIAGGHNLIEELSENHSYVLADLPKVIAALIDLTEKGE